MARFEKLEFDSTAAAGEGTAKQTPADRDQTEWLPQADDQRRTGNYENALRYYSRALEGDKSLMGGWVGQVQMLILLEEYPEAEMWSRKALELFPANGDLLAGRAQALCRMKDLKQAHVLCDGSLGQSGQTAYRWIVRGELLVAGRQDTDRHCFDKAMQIDGDWLVPLEIALVYLHYRAHSKALNRVHRAVEKVPDQHYAWYIQGLCQYELGLLRQARQSFGRCLELCPRHADAERRLADMERPAWPTLRSIRRLFGWS